MSISKNQKKLINSLKLKKYRNQHGLFVAEGIKVVDELLRSDLILHKLFTADLQLFSEEVVSDKIVEVTDEELKKISTLKNPNKVLGIFEIPQLDFKINEGLILALDDINDPGNLGTIIRLCDWFGVQQLICSKNTVDCYNQKVVQSTMGSITRVAIKYLDLTTFLSSTQIPIYIADMNGSNLYKTQFPESAIIVLGNEANGVSETVRALANKSITIPRFGESNQTESLNVATAASILLSEFRRGFL